MSTRGIYKIEGVQIYIHHDNYPSGAAVRFAETLRRNGGNISAFEFVRANERAELFKGKIPSDVEFIYEVKDGKIYCYRWEGQYDLGYEAIPHSSGEIHEWINENIKPCLEESDDVNDYTFMKIVNEYGEKLPRFFSISYLKSEVVRKFNQGLSQFSAGMAGNSSSSFSDAGRYARLIEGDSDIDRYREQYLKVWSPLFAQRYGHKDTETFDKRWPKSAN